jgi:sulfur carrier protein
MTITINGKEQTIEESDISVTKLLELQKVKAPDMVSVEHNGSILKRDTFGETIVKDGDQVEFLYFMGGGR